MPGCSAGYCTNSSSKGFQMCRFPKNPDRRKTWVENVNRSDWLPGASATICEVHFADEMWEKTRNGRRRLKSCAVPTIFSNNSSQSRIVQDDPLRNIDAEPIQLPEVDVEHVRNTRPCTKDEFHKTTQVGEDKTAEHDVNYDATDKPGEISSEESTTEEEKTSLLNVSTNDTNSSHMDIVERLNKLEKLYEKSERLRRRMKKKLYLAKHRIKRLEKEVRGNKIRQSISNIFNEDQVKLLSGEYKKVSSWCNQTLLKAYKLKFACGTAGYEELLKANFPYPSLRTLSRKLENLKFESGICEEVLEFLKIKISQFQKDTDRDCMLVLDEMSITPGNMYDAGTNTIFGYVTLPNHQENVATHGLVFMLAGLCSRWKQTIGYYFTGDKVDGEKLKPIIEEIINKAEAIGLLVHNVTSDMGPINQAMWRAFGIQVSRLEVINTCTHPSDPNRLLFFYADTPHTLKNTKAGLINNEIITIPNAFVEKYKLPTNLVQSRHLNDVPLADEECDLKLAPKLRSEYLSRNNHFQKMRVNNAMRVISEDVSAALKLLTQENPKDERLTTAWFIDFVARWFRIMSCRNLSVALGFLHPEKYVETINFLWEVIQLFTDLKVGQQARWKPFQTAIILSTTTVIQLSSYLLNERGFQFFLASRLTQDCLENLFSVMRMKNVIPNALQFKNNLKLICISQYMKSISNSSYEDDDRQFLSEFLDILLEKRKAATNSVEVPQTQVIPNITTERIVYNRIELNKIYNIAGYIVTSIAKKKVHAKLV